LVFVCENLADLPQIVIPEKLHKSKSDFPVQKFTKFSAKITYPCRRFFLSLEADFSHCGLKENWKNLQIFL
jgi:hypothetical protein